MNTSKLTKKRMLGAHAAVAITLGLGAAWAGAASGGPSPEPPAADKVPSAVDLPDAAVREITAPGNDRTVSAMFHNCRVVSVVSPQRVYEVTKTNGTKGSRIVQGGYFIQAPDGGLAPLPPFDPACEGVGPTPEQAAEMHRIAGGDFPPTPPWMPGDAPRP